MYPWQNHSKPETGHLELVFRETGKLAPSRLSDSRLIEASAQIRCLCHVESKLKSREPCLINLLSVQYQSHFDYVYCNFVSVPFRIWNIVFASCWCTNRDRKNHRTSVKNDLEWFLNKFSPYFSFCHPRNHFSSCYQKVAFQGFHRFNFNWSTVDQSEARVKTNLSWKIFTD